MFSKLLVLALLIAVAWYGMKAYRRIQEDRARAIKRGEGPAPAKPKTPAVMSEDMVKCTACGVYVAPDAQACGKPGCPQRG